MGGRVRTIAVVMAAALLWCTAGASLGSGEIDHLVTERAAGPAPAPPETTVPTTTTTVAPAPVAPAAPRVARAPRVRRAGYTPPVIGRLRVPSINIDETLFEGGTLAQIDFGPSHMPSTAMPGRLGNSVVAGHRVTHTHPFRHLDKLPSGARAIFEMPYGTYTYEWTGTTIVNETQTEILDQPNDYVATLFACHPPGSSRYRIVTHWRLLGAPSVPPTTTTPRSPPSSSPKSVKLPGR